MQTIPLTLRKQFEEHLKSKAISNKFHGEYKKWLQYYLDFCRKYGFIPENHESLPHFKNKLRDKRQTKAQQDQADEAITSYYQFIKGGLLELENKVYQPKSYREDNLFSVSEPRSDRSIKEKAASWANEYNKLEDEIHLRHYSPKTLKTYRG